MAPALIIALVIIFVAILSQFGNRLPASHAVLWWAIFGFLLGSSINPEILRPIANWLGISVISNMVFAGLLVLLMAYQIVLAHVTHRNQSKVDGLVAHQATRNFIQSNNQPAKGGLIFFPVFNEQGNIELISQAVDNLRKHQQNVDFLFVNDGSTDNTAEILNKHFPNEVAHHAVNVRVSGVLRTAFSIAREKDYEFVVQCDADGQHPINFIPNLIDAFRARKADLVIGSRFLSVPFDASSTTRARAVGIFILRGFIRLLWRSSRVTDPTSGFRAYSKRAVGILLEQMPEEYPEPESIGILASRGAVITEIPVSMQSRVKGKSSISKLDALTYAARVASALVGLRLRTVMWSAGEK